MEHNPYAASYSPTPSPGNAPDEYKDITPSTLVLQVRIVAVLNAVQGGLELMMAFLFLAALFLLRTTPGFFPPNGPNGPPRETMLQIMTLVYGLIFVVFFGIGVLRIVACFRNWQYRGRIMGIVSIVIGMISCLGLYCAPTSLGILIYGLIIFLNPSVAQAFEKGQQGEPGDKIIHEFSAYRG